MKPILLALMFCAVTQAKEIQPTRYGFRYDGCFCMYLTPERNQPLQFFRAVTLCDECAVPGPLRWVGNEIECPIADGFESWFLTRGEL